MLRTRQVPGGRRSDKKDKTGAKNRETGAKIGKLAQKIGCYSDKKVGWTTRKG